MLELPHTLVGITIVKVIPNPLISLPLALASHIILDSVPHWNPLGYKDKNGDGHFSKKSLGFIVLDSLLSITAVLYFLNINIFVIPGAFFAVLPDLLSIPEVFFNIKITPLKGMFSVLENIHNENSTWIGVTTQILTILACLYVLL